MDPYSKTKSISINRKKSSNSPWDEKENVDSNIDDKRPRSISNESPLRKSSNLEYKNRKSEIVEGLKSAYERKMNNLPRHINPKTYVKDCQTQDIEKIIKIEMEVPYNQNYDVFQPQQISDLAAEINDEMVVKKVRKNTNEPFQLFDEPQK